MATRYWVGGNGSNNWGATAPTNWSATSGGAGNATVPATGDDVIFDGVGASANQNCVFNTVVSLNSLDINGYTGTPTHPGIGITITGNDAGTPGGIGKALRLNVNYASSASAGGFTLTSTSGTTTIDTNGGTTGSMVINGAGGTFLLASALNCIAAGTSQITLTAGTFNQGGFTVTTRNIVCAGSGVRAWTMTDAALVLETGNHGILAAFDFSGSNLSLSASGSSITVNQGSTPTGTLSVNFGTSQTYNNVTLNGATGALVSSFANVITVATGVTMTTFTLNGPMRASSTAGTYTLTNLNLLGTSTSPLSILGPGGNATVFTVTNSPTISYTILSETTFTNGAVANNSIDLGRNSNITINPPAGEGGGFVIGS